MTPSQQRKHKGCILVIDDGQASLNLLCTILTEDGYAVHERPLDLGSQLRFVKDTLPDLVLVDVRKPGTDGYQVCANLKSDTTTRAIPVIFISSIDLPMQSAKAAVSGGVDYVTAPFDVEEVLWRIETHIHLRSLQENLKSAEREKVAAVNAVVLEQAQSLVAELTDLYAKRHHLRLVLRGLTLHTATPQNYTVAQNLINSGLQDDDRQLPMSQSPIQKASIFWKTFADALETNADAKPGEYPTLQSLWS